MATTTKRGWGVGCRACAGNKIRSSLGLFRLRNVKQLQLITFRLHQQSVVHQMCLGKDVPAATARLAPLASKFQEVLEARRGRRSLSEIAASLKVNRQRLLKMQFCLAESHRHYVRLFLKKAKCIVLHTDAKGGRLVTRFSATTARLRHLRGTLPFQKEHNSTAKGRQPQCSSL